MKNFHPLSFVLGMASGLLVLVLVMGGMRALHPMPAGRGYGGQFGGQGGTQNIARMAQRLGMTEDEVNAELKSGKTMPQIMQEHGVTFGGRSRSASGATMSASSASASSLSSSSAQ